MKYKVKYHEYEFKLKDAEAIKTPERLHEVVRDEYSPVSEEMYLLILNIKNQIINKLLLVKGSYNSLVCTPADVFTPVLKENGRNFVIAHNHPSGDVSPSKEDIIFTHKIAKACEYVGLNFLDHIIYTPDDFYSFKKNGII